MVSSRLWMVVSIGALPAAAKRRSPTVRPSAMADSSTAVSSESYTASKTDRSPSQPMRACSKRSLALDPQPDEQLVVLALALGVGHADDDLVEGRVALQERDVVLDLQRGDRSPLAAEPALLRQPLGDQLGEPGMVIDHRGSSKRVMRNQKKPWLATVRR